ncbi:FAD-dependent oxidoreductase [Chromatiales bacterium (ex Bugula neritina AB1)]|nr:FAD-dependent oxidoreductase [Chromatiales bacterium (ex Bugula neritina AB1)]
MSESEFAVVGGGVVGLSIAYGLLCKGKSVSIFDENDNALRASRGNFGLVWVQGKGAKLPEYAKWTRQSARAWKLFAEDLTQESGIDLHLQQRGGYSIYLSEQSLTTRAERLYKLKDHLGGDYPFEVLDHNALKKEEPQIGPKVAGAILHHEDGHVNSLLFLRTLAQVVRIKKARMITGSPVTSIEPVAESQSVPGGFCVQTSGGEMHHAQKVVLCAGLGSRTLGKSLGFSVPIRAQRGQVLVTEKMPSFINRPSDEIRQVDEGGIQIGASAEEVGPDDRETLDITARLAKNAIDQYPALAQASLVRSWAALRIMSPDGFPIYQHSQQSPGAFFVTCHSGITLAAAHASLLTDWLSSDNPDTYSDFRFPSFNFAEFNFKAFSEDRFDA